MIELAGSFHINALPFSCKPAAEPASRFYTMSRRRDCQLQRLVRQRPSVFAPLQARQC
jgi:hypothetical protein